MSDRPVTDGKPSSLVAYAMAGIIGLVPLTLTPLYRERRNVPADGLGAGD